MTLFQPIIWLLLFGALFKAVARIPGLSRGSYIDYLTPGIVVMLAIFSAGWTGMGFIEDIKRRRHGPRPRLARLARRAQPGMVAYAGVTILIQTLVIVFSRSRSAPTTRAASGACS